jgi:tetratricopeptide (TPR) repeat protein
MFAQLNSNLKAKLYFTEAEKMYKQGDFDNSLKYMTKAESTLGTTVARILALKVKIYYAQGNFIEAKKHIDNYTANYMQNASQDLNDEILALYINIEEAADKLKKEKRIALVKENERKRVTLLKAKAKAKKRKEVEEKYDYVRSFYNGLAAVQLNEKWGFINKNGVVVISIKYDYALNFSGGKARVKLNGRWFSINKKGNKVD